MSTDGISEILSGEQRSGVHSARGGEDKRGGGAGEALPRREHRAEGRRRLGA